MEVAALVASIVSVVLGGYAILLSFLFYRMTESGQREIEKASRDIASSVEKVEELFDRMYTDVFGLFRDSYNNLMGIPESGELRTYGRRGRRRSAAQEREEAPETPSQPPVEKVEVPLSEREELLLRVFNNLKTTRSGPIRVQDLLKAASEAGFGSWPVSEWFGLLNKGRLFATGGGYLDDIVSDDPAEVTAVSQKTLDELRQNIERMT
jgi:hypothetical protein